MKTIGLLAAAGLLSAFAAAAPASAQHAGLAPMRSSPKLGPDVDRQLPRFGHFGGYGRHGGWRHGFGGYGFGYGLIGGWGGGLIEDPEAYRDAGYFAGRAEGRVEDGRAIYDYDRAYPYDWYRDPPARTALPIARPRSDQPALIRCSIEKAGIRVCRGRR